MSAITDIEKFLLKYMDLIEDNKFEELYEQARIEFPTNANIIIIPRLNGYFLQAGIDPLEYLEVIPAFFIQYEEEITSITIPNHTKKIKDAAFRGLKIKEFIFPSKVTAIGNYCLSSNKELDTVMLPKNPSSIGSYMFAECEKLTGINYPGTKAEYLKSNFNKRKRWLTRSYIKRVICTDGFIEINQD